ncbi:MAG: tRNA-dihydrouridine synthase family protein [Alphaproteobacteria bacterium]|nr:tRNA-dihydrouridine synthase family protein [Alphaproteobacteria bacterium]
MAGVSDYPFRQMIRHFGNQPLFSEMIGAETLVHGHRKTLKMLTFDREYNIIVQLVGNNPKTMAEAAQIISDMGVVGIDINMGCPVKKLIHNHSGAMLMKDQDLALRIVESIKKTTKLPVSVKTRLGWTDKAEILTFAPRLVSAGIDQLEVHTRTKAAGYTGHADWMAVKDLNLPIPVLINGDIVSKKTVELAIKQSHTSGALVGRALLGRPWLLNEIETGKKPHVCVGELALEHLDLLLLYYGHAGLYVARKHLAWYARHKKGVAKWRQKMYLEEDREKLKNLVQDFWKGEE